MDVDKLKSEISEFYNKFETFIKTLDHSKDKNTLDKEIQDKFDSYNHSLITLINSNFPINESYNNNLSRAYYYNIVGKEFEKFFTLWQEYLDSI